MGENLKFLTCPPPPLCLCLPQLFFFKKLFHIASVVQYLPNILENAHILQQETNLYFLWRFHEVVLHNLAHPAILKLFVSPFFSAG